MTAKTAMLAGTALLALITGACGAASAALADPGPMRARALPQTMRWCPRRG